MNGAATAAAFPGPGGRRHRLSRQPAGRPQSPEVVLCLKVTQGLAAVVLAGGRAARLGGADKPALVVGGQPLLATAIAAAASAGASQIVIVGPPRPRPGRAAGRPGLPGLGARGPARVRPGRRAALRAGRHAGGADPAAGR